MRVLYGPIRDWRATLESSTAQLPLRDEPTVGKPNFDSPQPIIDKLALNPATAPPFRADQ